MPRPPTATARVSPAAHLSAACAISAITGMAATLAGVRFGLVAPVIALAIFTVCLGVGGFLALLLGIVGLVRSRAGAGQSGGRKRWLGVLVGAGLVTTAAVLLSAAISVPMIHDLTTDLDDPPVFTFALQHADNEGRDLSYPHGGAEVPRLQRQAYPDIQSIRLEVAPDEAFAAARRAAMELGWTVTAEMPEDGVLEAYDVTRFFRFVDDLVIRVRRDGDGSVVDIRSTSRVGRGDLGANAARIRRFAERIREHAR